MESVELCCHSVRSLWRGSRRRTNFPFYTFHFPFAYFGPHQTLPEGANTNHYYWVDVVVNQANARVTFEGDGYSHLPDPAFIARAGDTNRVILLLGKPYEIHCNMPVRIVSKEDVEIEVSEADGSIGVVWPVSLEFVPLAPMRSSGLRSHGASGGTTIAVHPERAGGGGFGWTGGFCCYYLAADGTPVFDCDGNCGCRGCFTGDITYGIGGFMMTFDGLQCSCEDGSGDDPAGEGDGYGDDDGPYAGGASATFSKSAVIFEDKYENSPGVWVERQSTVTELHCVAHGGPNGGHVRFEVSAGAGKLERVTGRVLPVEQDIEAGKKLDFTVGYRGQLPSGEAEDIVVTTTFTENDEGAEPVSSQAKLTSVKVELKAKETAPANHCLHRREYGVGEGVDVYHTPIAVSIEIEIDSTDAVIGVDNDEFYCPWNGGQYNLEIGVGNAIYSSGITVVEPHVYCQKAQWDGVLGTIGCAGQLHMDLFLYVMPSNVSFNGVFMVEIPDDVVRPHDGYFNGTDTNKVGALSHTVAAGAGVWRQVHGSAWAIDGVGRRTTYPQPWSNGWKTWEIPVGWGDALHVLKGRLVPNPTTQIFTISSNGTATIEKYGHVIERRIDNKVFKDGVLQNP